MCPLVHGSRQPGGVVPKSRTRSVLIAAVTPVVVMAVVVMVAPAVIAVAPPPVAVAPAVVAAVAVAAVMPMVVAAMTPIVMAAPILHGGGEIRGDILGGRRREGRGGLHG